MSDSNDKPKSKPKMVLPSETLDVTLIAGKGKAIVEAASSKNTEYVVSVGQLRTIPGFNVRIRETEDYRAHVEGLKQSIREHGFYANKPLAGYIGKDGNDDVIYITDGHTRLEAVLEINEEDVDGTQEIVGLPVVLKPADSSINDLTIALVQDNNGRPLTPYEMGIVVRRLQGAKDAEGTALFSKSDIARKLGITERYIDDLNVLVGAPAKVRNAVLSGEVSSTLAIQELRKNPKKAEERITTAVTKAKAKGKTKATKKDIAGNVRMQKVAVRVSLAAGETMGAVLQSLAKQIREHVPHTGKDEGDALGVDGTISVTIEIPAPPKVVVEKTEEPEVTSKPAAKKAPAKKVAEKPVEKVAKKPSQADLAAAAEKLSKKAKAAKKAPAPVAEADEDEGEPVQLPPAVPGADVDDPDDI